MSSGSDADGEGSPWVERGLVVASTVFTFLLFAFAIWQGLTTPAAVAPTATIADTETLANRDVKVAVVLRNAGDTGLISATVEVQCETPPPELTFEHVPADDRRTGFVTCPPGTESPTVTVSAWTEA